MEVEYLTEKGAQKVSVESWCEGFDPDKYELPTKSLPPHPNAQRA
jgi:hypothetical protein